MQRVETIQRSLRAPQGSRRIAASVQHNRYKMERVLLPGRSQQLLPLQTGWMAMLGWQRHAISSEKAPQPRNTVLIRTGMVSASSVVLTDARELSVSCTEFTLRH